MPKTDPPFAGLISVTYISANHGPPSEQFLPQTTRLTRLALQGETAGYETGCRRLVINIPKELPLFVAPPVFTSSSVATSAWSPAFSGTHLAAPTMKSRSAPACTVRRIWR